MHYYCRRQAGERDVAPAGYRAPRKSKQVIYEKQNLWYSAGMIGLTTLSLRAEKRRFMTSLVALLLGAPREALPEAGVGSHVLLFPCAQPFEKVQVTEISGNKGK
jgi:hypothetical protein